MNGIFLPLLYVMSGICAFAALHHGIAATRRRVNRVHLLFTLTSLIVALYILARARAYSAQTVDDLVLFRRWEVGFICLFFIAFTYFIAEYTGVQLRRLKMGLTVFFLGGLLVNAYLPYGVHFPDQPQLHYFVLPWGESIVDMRVINRGFWHNLLWLGVFVFMGYALYACYRQHRSGQQKQAIFLMRALAILFICMLLNFIVNRQIIHFVHVAEFGFLAIVVLMNMEMMIESRDQRRRMGALLDHLPAAICLKDTEGRIELINRQFATYFDVSEDEVIGKSSSDFFPSRHAALLAEHHQQVIREGKSLDEEWVLTSHGRSKIYELHMFPLLRPDAGVYAVCSVYIDITESRQKDEAMQKLRLQVWHVGRIATTGVISGSLAHELCQPLSAILNNAQAGLRFLARDPVDLEEMRALLEDIVSDDKRAGAIINGLRALLQKQEIPFAEIDLSVIIKAVLELLHTEFVRLNVRVEIFLAPGLSVRGSNTQLQQVVLNLVMNALEAMEEGAVGQRVLTVKAERNDGRFVVSFRDTGTGIPQEDIRRIFDGFYTTKPNGLGMGLEVCRSIIETHRGTLWAQNHSEGGAVFYFSLPFAEEANTQSIA